jgi:Flp pilus assembly protein TadD
MKKILFVLFAFVFTIASINAQEGKKALKQASKNLGKYNQDPMNNIDKLEEALSLLSVAFESEEVTSDPESYNVKGKIYNEIANAEIRQLLLDPEYNLATPNAANEAYIAFNKAIEMATKGHHTKDALNGLAETEGHLNNVGITMFQVQKYSEAFDNFNNGINAYKLLKDGGKDSRLDEEATRNDHYFYTAAAGYYGERYEDAMPLLLSMKETTDKPIVFEALFNANLETDKKAAELYLSEGRVKFPSDTGLLFAEINFFLKEGRLDELVDKLKVAIEKEPDNATVYVTLGNVYDQLSQAATKEENTEKAAEYFDSAKDYYSQTLTIDSVNFDATYSLGALYYNKAAAMTEEINLYANDFSKAGTQKYNDAKARMDGLFNQATPHFLAAEKIQPTDANTLIALKEIYARMGNLEKAKEYKLKLEE